MEERGSVPAEWKTTTSHNSQLMFTSLKGICVHLLYMLCICDIHKCLRFKQICCLSGWGTNFERRFQGYTPISVRREINGRTNHEGKGRFLWTSSRWYLPPEEGHLSVIPVQNIICTAPLIPMWTNGEYDLPASISNLPLQVRNSRTREDILTG